MDKIKLSELKVETIIGIWEWEKKKPTNCFNRLGDVD